MNFTKTVSSQNIIENCLISKCHQKLSYFKFLVKSVSSRNIGENCLIWNYWWNLTHFKISMKTHYMNFVNFEHFHLNHRILKKIIFKIRWQFISTKIHLQNHFAILIVTWSLIWITWFNSFQSYLQLFFKKFTNFT